MLERRVGERPGMKRALDLQRRLGGVWSPVRSGAISENHPHAGAGGSTAVAAGGGRPAEAERRVHRRIPAQYPDQYRLVRRRATGGLGGGRATSVRGA
ncbi:hypothetical protein ACPA9J_00750 [Pseudomonas aeruginosa]